MLALVRFAFASSHSKAATWLLYVHFVHFVLARKQVMRWSISQQHVASRLSRATACQPAIRSRRLAVAGRPMLVFRREEGTRLPLLGSNAVPREAPSCDLRALPKEHRTTRPELGRRVAREIDFNLHKKILSGACAAAIRSSFPITVPQQN